VAAHFAAQGLATDMGVGVHITDDRGRVLMGQRQGSHGAGQWSMPGGHIDAGETSPFAVSAREVQEEVGVEIAPQRLFLGATLDVFPEKKKAYLTIHVGTVIAYGAPKVMEPEKQIGTWQWFHSGALPSPTFSSEQRFLAGGGRIGGTHYTANPEHPGLLPPLTGSLRRWLRDGQMMLRGDYETLLRDMELIHWDLLTRVGNLSDLDLYSEVQLAIERYQANPTMGYLPGGLPSIQTDVQGLIADHLNLLRNGGGKKSLNAAVGNTALRNLIFELIREDTADWRKYWNHYLAVAIPNALFTELRSRRHESPHRRRWPGRYPLRETPQRRRCRRALPRAAQVCRGGPGGLPPL
jgi:8-oxo-dGTP diphosphatase